MSYNYNPKVLNSSNMLPQMISESYKPPFYFGGSQIPLALNVFIDGSGFKTPYTSSLQKKKMVLTKGTGLGVGLKTSYSKHDVIRLPQSYYMK
jgi:hypothetical protein